jgi:hypothetical protein
MKIIKVFAIALFLLISAMPVQADGEYIGPAFRVFDDYCAVYVPDDWTYEGTNWIQYSNGKTGHATYKCKLHLTEGDPQVFYSEFAAFGIPVPGGDCWNVIDIDGEKGMWTGQCFGVWEDGD